MSQVRRIITSWVGRLKARADTIERRMEGRTGVVLLSYRVGRLMKVGYVFEYEDADAMVEPD